MSLGSGWYYNSVSGAIIDQPPVLGLPQGWLPDWHGPFATRQDAVDYGDKLAAEGKGAKPTGLGGNVGNTVSAGAKNAASDITKATGIDWGHWLIRGGELLLGIVLIAIGVAHVTKAVPVATKVATKVGAGALAL